MTPSRDHAEQAPWLLLIHQIPPKPDYLRVKIGRRLQRVGAVAVKNSVYVLPDRPSSLEDFQWIRAEVVEGGGDASICEAAFVDGLTDSDIQHVFRDARDIDYTEIADAARELRSGIRRRDRESAPQSLPRSEDDLSRLRKRFSAVVAIDFFGAAGRTVAESALRDASEALRTPEIQSGKPVAAPEADRAGYRGRTWVTRAGVFVDRMASAWLIRRFIDRDARFRFVTEARHNPAPGELRFDMFEGEFTHEGDHCTFETLLDRFGLADAALRSIAEIVHDIDLKDEKFGREDAAGIERVFSGIAAATADDTARLDRGAQVLDELHALFTAQVAASGA